MQTERQDIRRQFLRKGRRKGLVIVVLAAILIEAIAALQYNNTRNMLESDLEQQVLIMLRSSAMRLDGILKSVVAQASSQIWHAQQRLGDPKYVETMAANLVKNGNHKVVGAAVAFRPDYYPQKGRWYEPYAHWQGDTISVEQIASAQHDYTQLEFYRGSIGGDTIQWSKPYMDREGAGGEVVTYAMPLRDGSGQPVAVLGIDVTTQWISETINEIRLHPSSFCLVLSEQGNIIAAPADSLCQPELAARIAAMTTDPTVEKADKAGGRVTSFRFRDEATRRSGHVYFARKKNAPHWLMVKAVYDEDAFGELADLQRDILWATLAGLIALGFIIQLFARNGRKLQESLMQQQRTDRELQIANHIQQTLLPTEEEPTLRAEGRVMVEGSLIPAREVGGDLYNVLTHDDRLYFCIGDVSGKGVPAALIMTVTQTLFNNIASQQTNPATIVDHMNATTCRNNKSNMFVTLFVGVLDLKTGRLDYCNAGHEPPLLDGKPLDVVANMPIGLFDDFAYAMQTTTIPPGATLLLYTDGLTEARNAQHQLMGREGLMQLAGRHSGKEPKELVGSIIADVKHYAEHTEQSDDLTLLAIKYNASSN